MMENRGIRLFFAAKLPLETTRVLEDWCDATRAALADCRWVEPANYHITLRFLGWTKPELKTALVDRASQLLSSVKKTNFRLRGTGAFPSLAHAQVLFAELENGGAWLSELSARFEELAVDLGFSPEKRDFHPHLTLARIGEARDLRELLVDADPLEAEGSQLSEVALFESKVGDSQSQYRAVHSWSLE